MKIAIFNEIDMSIVEKYLPDFKEVDLDDSPEAIITRSHDFYNVELPKSVWGIFRSGAGVDNIPIKKCSGRGIAVFNAPGANANAVKEATLGMLFAVSRKMFTAHTFLADSPEAVETIEADKKRFRGKEIKDKKILVVGLGAIGSAVAKACGDLGMEVYGYDPYVENSAVKTILDLNSLNDFDYITLHTKLTDETNGLVNENFLHRTKRGAVIINFARGGLVDSEAIVRAIRAEQVAGYGTDFPDEKLLRAGNSGLPIYCLPHIGAMTPEAKRAPLEMVLSQLIDFRDNGNVEHSVNLPNIRRQWSTPLRLTVINENMPGMLGKINKCIGGADYNITGSVHETKNEIGYGLFDIESAPGSSLGHLINKLEGMKGITKVRLLRKTK